MSSKVRVLDFAVFRKRLATSNADPLQIIAEKPGVVYVVMVTRDRCSSCDEQKPLFAKLSNRIKKEYSDKVEFLRVNCSYAPQKMEEAKACSDDFRTPAFPTYIITMRDDEGNTLETFRSLDAPIKEIKRNIKMGIILLDMILERSARHNV